MPGDLQGLTASVYALEVILPSSAGELISDCLLLFPQSDIVLKTDSRDRPSSVSLYSAFGGNPLCILFWISLSFSSSLSDNVSIRGVIWGMISFSCGSCYSLELVQRFRRMKF